MVDLGGVVRKLFRTSFEGSMHVITGPVGSKKNEALSAHLDPLIDSGRMAKWGGVIVSHPMEGEQVTDRHKADLVTSSAQEVYSLVLERNPGIVVIAGASQFAHSDRDDDLSSLCRELFRSNRKLILSGPNLDINAEPYGIMPQLLSRASSVELVKGVCHVGKYKHANRSMYFGEELRSVCAYHLENPGHEEPINHGMLHLYLGPMFSGKSSSWRAQLFRLREEGIDPLVIKWTEERYAAKVHEVALHNGLTERAQPFNNVDQVRDYLKKHSRKKVLFWDELQFFPGCYELIKELIPKGYRIYGTGLPRDFRRIGFNDIPNLMCLADEIEINEAYCDECSDPATESQRVARRRGIFREIVTPAGFHGDLVLAGGSEDYRPTCISHHDLPGKPPTRFPMPTFYWGRRRILNSRSLPNLLSLVN